MEYSNSFQMNNQPGSQPCIQAVQQSQSVEVSEIAITPPAVYPIIAAWNLSHQTS